MEGTAMDFRDAHGMSNHPVIRMSRHYVGQRKR
jgi:hypothetical protein